MSKIKIRNKLMTLCFICKNDKVLLGMKKIGFGTGWWNGFGGKVREGEDLVQTAIREVEEEVGIKVKKLEERGVLYFHFKKDPEVKEVHVFDAGRFEGKPKESKEMKPKWFAVSHIPYEKMWPADRHWIPVFLKGLKFEGKINFDENKKVIDYNIVKVD